MTLAFFSHACVNICLTATVSLKNSQGERVGFKTWETLKTALHFAQQFRALV
jgi:hypothetical protein